MPDKTTVPDFEALFTVTSDDADDCLTAPRAAWLHLALGFLGNFARADIDAHRGAAVEDNRIESWAFFGRLPRSSWRRDLTWRRRWAPAAEHLAGQLAHGKLPVPRCIAEEIILYLAIDEADAHAADSVEDHPELPALPPYSSDDWEELRDVLFDDLDFLALFSAPAEDAKDRDRVPYTAVSRDDMGSSWFERFSRR